jgi:DNA-binding response OmpR family regulator
MRLLLVDGSLLMEVVVRYVAPSGVEVERVVTFEGAREALMRDPPQAAIFSLTPTPLPWQTLEQLCREHQPPIPFVYLSSVHSSAAEAGLPEEAGGCFLPMPMALSQLRQQIEKLVGAARPAGTRPGEPRRQVRPLR